MALRIITTGGTFDKLYHPLTGELVFGASQVPALIELARPAEPPVIEALMAIDSLDMTDAHRTAVLDACRASPQKQVVVVHGTDTMVQTAAVLAQAHLPATIVLTGAMVPASVSGSDAGFNLAFAMACAATLAPGVWIAMNGQAHPWDRVRKNRALGRFESIPPSAS